MFKEDGVIRTEKIQYGNELKTKKTYLLKNENGLTVYTIGDRNIYLAGDINTESISEVNTKLIAALTNITHDASILRNYDMSHINLHIQSGGGSIHDMWGLIDYMLTSPIPIFTYAVGLTASAALKIFLAGSVRYVFPHTTLMYHDLSAGNNGKLQDLEEWKSYLQKEQQKIEDYVKQRTFMKTKQLKEIREKKIDFYMDADEAINLRLCNA